MEERRARICKRLRGESSRRRWTSGDEVHNDGNELRRKLQIVPDSSGQAGNAGKSASEEAGASYITFGHHLIGQD